MCRGRGTDRWMQSYSTRAREVHYSHGSSPPHAAEQVAVQRRHSERPQQLQQQQRGNQPTQNPCVSSSNSTTTPDEGAHCSSGVPAEKYSSYSCAEHMCADKRVPVSLKHPALCARGIPLGTTRRETGIRHGIKLGRCCRRLFRVTAGWVSREAVNG